MTNTGDTTTSQLPRRALALRFLGRARQDVAQLRDSLPGDPLLLEPPVALRIEQLAHKISSETEAFGFSEISAIAAAIELLATGNGGGTLRHRLELATRLNAQIAALDAHVQNELEELAAQDAATPIEAARAGTTTKRY